MTSRSIGWIKGEPKRYIHGHQSRKPVIEYVEDGNGCWIWQRWTNRKGYGMMRPYDSKSMRYSHVVYYERANGPVPEGLMLDHLCRTPACVNPAHLEPVTNTENQRRGLKPKLSIEAVAEIRATPRTYGSTKALAERFNVATSTISRARNERGWILEW